MCIRDSYKDVDQRVAEGLGAEELSVGDFVLSGGEPAALCVLDAVVRLLPGALGDHESASGDSHYEGLLSPPSYTRPPFPREPFRLRLPPGLDSRVVAGPKHLRHRQPAILRRPDLWERHVGMDGAGSSS